MNRIVEKFHEILGRRPDGFLIDAWGGEAEPASGYAVGVASCGTVEEAASRVLPGQLIGYWFDGDGGVPRIEIVELYRAKASAVLAGHLGGQGAIYDFANDEVIAPGLFFKDPADEEEERDGVAPEEGGAAEDPLPQDEGAGEDHEGG